jgi:iron only hydrogenase large subunit-like protein
LEINNAWETIRENITISAKESLGYFELKKQKPWFDEGCSHLLDQRKQAKLQWLQIVSEANGDNLNNVRREARRHFRNKTREYLKHKIKELAKSSKDKSIRNLYIGVRFCVNARIQIGEQWHRTSSRIFICLRKWQLNREES